MGAAVAATDPDGDTLTYTLTGADAASFTIDGNGQIKVGQGTSLDYETKTSYSVTVNVSDGKDAQGAADTAVDATIDVTINVTDVLIETALPSLLPFPISSVFLGERGDGLPPYFPFAISGFVMGEPGDIGNVVLPEAEGGDGEFTYSLTGLPQGLSFDADTRTLSGTVAAGSHTLVYTATDEAGVSASFSFTLTVKAASAGGQSFASGQSTDLVRGQSDDIDHRRPRIRDMRVVRRPYSEPSSPGFTMSWNDPDMSTGTSGETDLVVEQYEFRYGKVGHGLTTYGAASSDSRSVALTGLEPGTEYVVQGVRQNFGDYLARPTGARRQG